MLLKTSTEGRLEPRLPRSLANEAEGPSPRNMA